ncbi:MAG: oxidoreductase [Bacteroidota bacterium]|nr:oxidoreductase [Bacteroidota bacterium]
MRSTFLSILIITIFAGCNAQDKESEILSDPSWEWQYQDSTSFFIGIHAIDEATVWAAGSNGRVVRSVDAGATWNTFFVPGADSVQFRDVHAFSQDHAVVLSIGNGTDSRIYRTTDGGQTWDLSFQNSDENAFFDCFSFWDASSGFAFSDSFEGEFTLIQTSNGGDSWSRINPAVVPDAREGEGAFAASGTCVHTWEGGLGWFATGASAVDTRVIRTTDYGASWTEAITPIASQTGSEGISTMSVLDADHLVIMGGDFTQRDSIYANVAISTDGGATWTASTSAPIGGSVYGSTYVPGAATPTLIGVAPTGTAFSTDNTSTWSRIDNTNFWTVSSAGVDATWAAGPGGVARLVNGPNK